MATSVTEMGGHVRGIRKPFLIVVACMLLASGCTKSGTTPIATGGGKYGSGVNTDFGDEKKQQGTTGGTSSGSSTNGSSNSNGSSGGAARPTLPPDYGGGGGGTAVDLESRPYDNGDLGSMGYWYLNKAAPKLVVEIDAVHGMAPTATTLNMLRSRLASVADKPGGVQILPAQDIGKGRDTWSMDDVRRTKDKFRTHFSDKTQAVMHILFVDGQPDRQGPIGIAYSASTDVIFEQVVRDIATPLVPAQSIEEAVVIHEVGHILSLINEGYTSPRKHEDAQHEGHSNNQGSVMYWALDNSGVVQLLGGRTKPPDDYDADDRADLRDVRDGKLKPR